MPEQERVLLGIAPVALPDATIGFVDARVMAFEWSADGPFVTVAIKTSASFAHEPLSGEVPAYWVQPPVFDPAVDVAPARRACDVHVCGSADIPQLPSGYAGGRRALQVSFGPALTLSCSLDARHTGRVKLGPETLVDAGGVAGFDLGPRRGPRRDPREGGALELEAWQLAPQGRRIPFDEPIEEVQLSGFFAPPEPILIKLPVLTPRLLVDPRGAGGELTEQPAVLDTLTIDLDRLAVDMVWRSVFRGRLRELDRLIVGFGPDLPEPLEERWNRLLAELPRGRFSLTYALADVDAGSEPPALDDAALAMARLSAWESPRGPTPTISLEKYADVTAELLEGRDERKLVLAKHQLDEDSFAIEEKAWASLLSEVPEEEPSLASELGGLIIEAQNKLAHPAEASLGIKEYALLYAHMEVRDPSKVLASHPLLDLGDGRGPRPLSQAAFMRLERRVDDLIEEIPARQQELDEEIARVRATLSEGFVEPDYPEEVKKALAEAAAEEAEEEAAERAEADAEARGDT